MILSDNVLSKHSSSRLEGTVLGRRALLSIDLSRSAGPYSKAARAADISGIIFWWKVDISFIDFVCQVLLILICLINLHWKAFFNGVNPLMPTQTRPLSFPKKTAIEELILIRYGIYWFFLAAHFGFLSTFIYLSLSGSSNINVHPTESSDFIAS